MGDLKVKSESLPERCDICHKSDYFDPKTGQCSRCSGVERTAFARLAPPALRKIAYPLTQLRISDLGLWQGTIDRGQYLALGIVLFLIKRILDGIVVATFNRPWTFFSYLMPYMVLSEDRASIDPGSSETGFFLTLLTVSLPFIWAGVVLTLRRLRAAQLPVGLIALFFVPIVNLLFFLLLSVIPTRQASAEQREQQRSEAARGSFAQFLNKAMPDSTLGSAVTAVAITLLPSFLMVLFSVTLLKQYGMILFLLLPFCVGLGSTILHGFRHQRSYASCVLVSLLSVLILGVALLGIAVEGAVCLIMTTPIAAGLAFIGGSIGYAIQRRPASRNHSPTVLLLLIFLVPALMGAEYKRAPEPPLIAIRTAIEIDAAPEEVWQQLISFPEIEQPDEMLFHMGIAYPTMARIEGQGVGAVRYCTFSTGSFVEPIEVWDEPNLLKFSVAAQPLAMREWSPYSDIHPPHLDDYLHSRAGQFLLTKLPDGRTRLEGTTWYQQDIWPAAYWRLWSDFIIQKIHLRVLNHIKRHCEQKK